jgi:hypothetical protein
MKRESGYYWCCVREHWDIFSWYENGDCSGWYDGQGEFYIDSDFKEIDERKIIRQI